MSLSDRERAEGFLGIVISVDTNQPTNDTQLTWHEDISLADAYPET